MGPVQVLVVQVDRAALSGPVLAELVRLQAAGLVRLVDLLLLARAEDGTLETLELSDGPPGQGEAAAALLGRAEAGEEPASDEPTGWSLADAVPPGTTAAVALVEHVWAAPLRDILRAGGGRLLEETWLGSDDLAALEALLAQPHR